MTKAVSFRDVVHVLNMENMDVRELDLLDSKWDEKAKPILFELGIDVRFPLKISASKHRDLNDKVGIGFRYEGRMRRDKAWTDSSLCSVMERVAIAAYQDKSLAQEMCDMIGGSLEWIEGKDYLQDELPKSQLSSTYEQDSMLIDTLYELIKHVRGEEAVERW